MMCDESGYSKNVLLELEAQSLLSAVFFMFTSIFSKLYVALNIDHRLLGTCYMVNILNHNIFPAYNIQYSVNTLDEATHSRLSTSLSKRNIIT